MLQTIKAFVDTNKQIQLLEPIKFAKKQALVIILNDNEATTTGIENVLFMEKGWNKQEEKEAELHLQTTVTAHHKREAEMIAALKQDAEDRVYQAEIMAWDNVVGDGIDAKE